MGCANAVRVSELPCLALRVDTLIYTLVATDGERQPRVGQRKFFPFLEKLDGNSMCLITLLKGSEEWNRSIMKVLIIALQVG